MRTRRLCAGHGQGRYRDQSQKPLTGKEPSRAYARPAALRASLTAAARARQSSCRSSRQKESFSMSLRREAARTVFCFFFDGDELAKPSLALDRATAFSDAAIGTSPAGAVALKACGDSRGSPGSDAAAGASLRPNGSRAIGGLSTVFRIRTIRGLGAIADPGATACADVSLDSWTCTSADASGAILPARISGMVAGESALGLVRACVSWEAVALAASTNSSDALSEWRSATTPDTQIAPAIAPSSRAVAAMRISRRKRGEGDKNPNSGCRSECSMRLPCEKARQELSNRRTVPSSERKRRFVPTCLERQKVSPDSPGLYLSCRSRRLFRSPKFSARAPPLA
jgi:hypothetical protein